MTLHIIKAEVAASEASPEDDTAAKTSNALSDLIVAFFSLCPEANDDQVHFLAQALGYEPAGFEEVVYKLVGIQVAKDPEAVANDLKQLPATAADDAKDAPTEEEEELQAKDKPGKEVEESAWHPKVTASTSVVTEGEFLEPMDEFNPLQQTAASTALDDQLIDDGDPRPEVNDDNTNLINDGEASGQADNDSEKIALINDSQIISN